MTKTEYCTPYAEIMELDARDVLMTSIDGGLDDLGEISIIRDSINGSDEFIFF
ncbi:MAG: hypothetical protein K6F21_06190 [Bacteroidales bacterium]|nr:hypothetical protein [Bacteroidales bacterium]